MVIGGVAAPDYFFYSFSLELFFYLSQESFYLSQMAQISQILYDKPMSCSEKICAICAICEKIHLREKCKKQ
jgi:hypothetical protein